LTRQAAVIDGLPVYVVFSSSNVKKTNSLHRKQMTFPLRILLLEDDPLDAEIISTTLERDGITCDILRVETRDDFIAAIDRCDFDLILSDYKLPDFDGLSALAIAKERCSGIPFILISGIMGEEFAIETLKSGATDYVLKNRIQRLVPAVRRALQERAERKKRLKAVEALKKAHDELEYRVEERTLELSTLNDQLKTEIASRRQSEEHLRLFIDHAPAALAMLDRKMRYLITSRRWRSDYNLGERELRGLSHYEVFPEIPERWKAIHQRALAGEVLRGEGDRFERADGSVKWLKWEIHPWRDALGVVAGIVIFNEDISEIKLSEDKLIRINRLLAVLGQANRAIAEANDRAQFFKDISRIVVERGNFIMAWIGLVNRDTGYVDVASHYGYEEGYLSLMRITIDGNRPGGSGPTGTAIRENRYIINNNTQESDYMSAWPDEAIKRGYLSSAAFPIREHEKVIGALTVFFSEPNYFEKDEIELMQEIIDSISFAVDKIDYKQRSEQAEKERNRMEEQLRQAHKMEAIGVLAGGVAHDFNNILTAIIGFGTMAQRRVKDDEKTKKFIEEILIGANRAAELTHGLLAYSRKQIMSLKQVNLNDLVRKTNNMLERILREDIVLNIMLANRNLPVLVDESQIEQVLMNLVANARDAMPDGGFLILQTEEINIDKSHAEAPVFGTLGRYAVLTVSDTGIGMDLHTKEHIFEPFFTTKEVGRGTGLGLSMVDGTIKQHNGYINVFSEVGKGTTFRIYLPIAQTEEEASVSKPTEVLLRGKGETILVAEDDPHVRKVTVMSLQENGYKVIEAKNGEEAIERFIEKKDTIALVLLDVIMPVKNGKDAYEGIKKINPDAKALFLSGYTDDVISKKGILQEGFDFIAKPINPDTLMRKIREVLDR